MKKNTLIVLPSLFILSLFTLTTSCTKDHEVENLMIDSLAQSLNECKSNLNLDVALFEDRASQMDQNYINIRNNYSDSMSLDFGSNMTKYKTIRKMYSSQAKLFRENKKEYDELLVQVDNLRKSVNADQLTKAQFKEFYAQEKRDIKTLLASSEDSKRRLYAVEPEYERLDRFVSTVVEQMEAKSSE